MDRTIRRKARSSHSLGKFPSARVNASPTRRNGWRIERLEERRLLSATAFSTQADTGSVISGAVFNDLNGNGVRDTGEPGLAGWTVFVDANQNGVADPGEQTTTTDSAGRYTFPGLALGTYTIGATPPSGYSQTAPDNVAWQELGPDGINSIPYSGYPRNGVLSGKVVAIAPSPVDPNTIYIASSGGGVWKTTDAGQSWVPLTDNQPDLAMGSIAVSQSDPNVIYAGTGEPNFGGDAQYGKGILKSTDGGSTWTLLGSNVFNRETVSKIIIDPTNSDTVYAAVSRSILNAVSGTYGIWKSTNGGVTWTDVTATSIGAQAASATDLVMDPTNPQVLFTGIGEIFGDPTNGVWKTSNGGATWSRIAALPTGTAGGRLALSISSDGQTLYAAFSNPAQGAAFGHLLGFFHSTDGGTTWARQAATPDFMQSIGWGTVALATDPADPNRVYAGGPGTNAHLLADSIIRSDNGGASWINVGFGSNGVGPHVDQHAIVFDSLGRLWDGTDGGIYATDDEGATWFDANANLGVTQLNGVAIDPANPQLVFAGAQDVGTEVLLGAQVWGQIDGGDGGLVRIDPASHTVYHTFFYAKGQNTFFQRSDGGGPFQPKTTGIDVQDDSGLFYPPYVLDPSTPGRLLLGTDRVYETLNRGDLWAPISPVLGGSGSVITAIAVAPSNPQVIYITYSDNTVWQTVNGGTNWSRKASLPVTGAAADDPDGGDPPPGLIGQFGSDGALAVDPTNPSFLYLVRNKFGGSVFVSGNGGASWTNITRNLPNLPAHAIALDPRTSPPTLYLGTDTGVFRSADGGFSWTLFGVGLPNALVTDLQISTQGNFLDAATYGRGAWQIALNSPPAPREYTVTLTADRPSSGGNDFGFQAVNLPPIVGSVTADPNPAVAGGQITLAASGVTDADDSVATVSFYRETNGVPGLQVLGIPDALVGSGTFSNGAWTLTASTASLAPGVYTYYAVATDARGEFGAAASASETLLAGGSIAGSVFDDANNNGVQDASETAMAGINVSAGGVSATTDAQGNYVLAGLLAGTYTVTEQLPAGWARTTPLIGATVVTVADGQTATGPVFGNAQISIVVMNFDYLLVLAQHFNQPGTFATGDLNGDDTVNFSDLLLLAQNYGHPLGTEAPPAGTDVLVLNKRRGPASP